MDKNNINNDLLQSFNLITSKMIKHLFDKKDNHLFSPISFYMALGLLLEGASSCVYKELVSFLEIDYSKMKDGLISALKLCNYQKESGEVALHNGLFVNSDIYIYDDFLKRTNDYMLELFKVKSLYLDKEQIIAWINNHTKGLLKLSKDNFKIDRKTCILILSTLYYKENWSKPFTYTIKDNFYLINGQVTCNFMKHNIFSLYKETEDYLVVCDCLENDNTITYIMPKKEINFSIYEITKDLKQGEISLSVPQFKYNKEYDLKEVLKKFNVNKIFACDDSLNKLGKNLYVNDFKQNVGIEFNEKGITATSVTSTSIMRMSLTIIEKEFVLNHPFIYIIKDKNKIPLFIGVVNNPNN